MIYKISLIAAGVAAIVSFSMTGEFRKASYEAGVALKKSQKPLAEAREQEQEEELGLQRLIAFYGDHTEEQCRELEQARDAKKKELEAAKAEWEALSESARTEERDLRSARSDIRYENSNLERDIQKLERDIQKREKELAKRGVSPSKPPTIVDRKVQDPFAPANIDKIIEMTLNQVHPDKATVKALSEVFSDAVYQLGGHMSYSLKDLSNMSLDELKRYSPRAVKLKKVGLNRRESSIEIIMAYVYKGVKTKSGKVDDKSGYVHITYTLGDDGKIDGINSDESATEPSLSSGFTPYQYKGEDTLVAQ